MLTKTTFRTPEALGASRRKFLGKVGSVAGFTALAVACQKDVKSSSQGAANSVNNASASGDVAILNYAYLLEQLEAAFYIMVSSSFFSGSNEWERRRLKQIRDHEIAHREFFKTALGSAAIADMEFDLSSIDFSSRSSVLGAAKTFEDTGVSAYNGVAGSIYNPDYLVLAGKIVSVEARHAAYIRELISPDSFADNSVVNGFGLDLANPPKVVIAAVTPFLKTQIDFSKLPM